jgi:hypothetical protein
MPSSFPAVCLSMFALMIFENIRKDLKIEANAQEEAAIGLQMSFALR